MYEVRRRALLQLPPRRERRRRAHGLHRHALIAVALAGCGRVGFDDVPGSDASTDASSGAPTIALALPEGGQFRDLAISPSDGSWYALSFYGGLFRSSDAGASWTPCGPFPSAAVEVAANGDVFGAGDTTVRSTDGCATFVDQGAAQRLFNIGIDGTTVFGLGEGALWRYNGPGTWAQVATPLDGSAMQTMASSEGLRLLGSCDATLATSLDGVVWTQRTAGFPSPNIIDVYTSSNRSYALAGAYAGDDGGVACSTGSATTWSTCHAFGGTALAADPTDNLHVVVATYDDLTETVDAFGTFATGQRMAGGMDDAIIRDLRYTPTGTLVAASDRGVFASTMRPLQWQPRLSGLLAWTIDAIVRDGGDIFLGTEAGVLRSRAGGPFELSTTGMVSNTQAWRLTFAPDGMLVAPGRNIWGSSDRGTSWTRLTGLGAADGYYAHVIHFVGDRAYAGTQSRVLTAPPPYTSWTPLDLPVAVEVWALTHVGATIFIATNGGVFVTTDFVQFQQNQPGAACIDVEALPDGRVVAACDQGVFIADAPYSAFAQRLPGSNVSDVTLTDDGRLIVVGFDAGAHVSSDRGETWSPVTVPPGLFLQSAIHDPGDDSVVLGTFGHGLVRAPMP